MTKRDLKQSKLDCGKLITLINEIVALCGIMTSLLPPCSVSPLSWRLSWLLSDGSSTEPSKWES